MIDLNRTFCFSVLFALGLSGAAQAALTPEQIKLLPAASTEPVVFARDIKPIFEARCIQCHGRGRDKGGLQFDTRETLLKGGDSGPAVVVGKSEASLLIQLVSGLDEDEVMPKKGTRLTPTQVGRLRAWIDQGLVWDPAITFARMPPLNLTPPAPKVKVTLDSAVNPIDQILKPYFARNGFKSPRPVDDRLYARRVYLDAIGLLPREAELKSFLADRSKDKRARLAQRLLAENKAYAEHWLSFWDDLLRNDYRGTGYIDGGRKQITKWLFTALSTNMPYDQFVGELINPVAGSEGFTRGIVWRGAVNASQTPQMQAAQNISQVFMGVNLKCASCHDSFINDWRLADAYGLACVYSDRPLEMFLCDKPTGKISHAAFIYPQLGEIDPGADKAARLTRLAELITSPQDGRLSRTIVNRLWAQCFGRGLVEPVDDMEQPAWNQDLLDWLAEDLVEHHYDLKHTLERIFTSEAYQMPAVNLGETSGKNFVFRGPGIRRLSAEEFRDALGELTGAWYEKAEFPAETNQIRASLVAADPLATALGRPNRDQVITTRSSTATTLQALELTNGKTLAEVLERGAEKLITASPSSKQLIQEVYGNALGREPTQAEAQVALELVGQPAQKAGLEDFLWAVAMLPEFQLIF
jgi:mono/diheme cytochrome c family protein